MDMIKMAMVKFNTVHTLLCYVFFINKDKYYVSKT